MAPASLVRALGAGRYRHPLTSLVRQFSSHPKEIDLSAPISLAEARTWDEGLSSKFASTPLSEIFKASVR